MTLIIETPNKQNTSATNILADSIAPLLNISGEQENAWWLWLDFIAEIQAKLMIVNEATSEEGFAFRCAENFKALRQTLGILASHGVNLQQLQSLKNEQEEQVGKCQTCEVL